jgi:hypothetical protein
VQRRVFLNKAIKLHERRGDVLNRSVATSSSVRSRSVSVKQGEAHLESVSVELTQFEASSSLGCDPALQRSASRGFERTQCVRNVANHLPSDATAHTGKWNPQSDHSDNATAN